MASVSSDAGSSEFSGFQQQPQGGQFPHPSRDNPHLPRRPKHNPLSQEELRVLEECNTESFWYRCVPLGAVFAAGSTFLVRAGYLKPHPRYGALFKNLGAVFVGYVVGKLSYQKTCQQKILEKIPNSNLAQTIRRNKGMVSVFETEGSEGSGMDTESSNRQEKIREVFSSMDMSGDSKVQPAKELDDTFRPTVDREVRAPEEAPTESIQPTLSYDELRQQNRQEYERTMASPSSPFHPRPFRTAEVAPSRELHPVSSSPAHPETENVFGATETERPASSRAGKKKNAYGDFWDD